MKRAIRIITAAVALALSAIYASCTWSGDSGVNDRHLAVSYIPQQAMLKEIAGPDFEVTALVSPGVNPETFDPSVSSVVSLSQSRVYFRMNTPGFEESALKKIRDNNSGMEIIDASRGITRITGTHPGPHPDKEPDPHFWSSVKNARLIAANMHSALARLYPERRQALYNNYRRLDEKLKQLDDSLTAILHDCRGASFVVMHPSMSYFARDYGLHQIAMETGGKEASPRQLSQRIEAARRSGARVMIHETEHSPAQAEAIARELGIPMVRISLNSDEWASQLISTANAIAAQCLGQNNGESHNQAD